MDYNKLAQDRVTWRTLVNTFINLGTHKDKDFLEQLNNYNRP
jgi:hypothetical protein